MALKLLLGFYLRMLLLLIGACSSSLLINSIVSGSVKAQTTRPQLNPARPIEPGPFPNYRPPSPNPTPVETTPPQPSPPSNILNPSTQPNLPRLPAPPPEILNPSNTPKTPANPSNQFTDKFTVREFAAVDSNGNKSRVFREKELNTILKNFLNRPITFSELLEAGSELTRQYSQRGYVTSAAIIPPQRIRSGVVQIQVIEGILERIQVKVTGASRLNPNYVRSRLELAVSKPLNANRLLEALQLLRLNPLIENISAELSAGSDIGKSVLKVKVKEAKSFSAQIAIDNVRSPSVGTFQRQVRLTEADLLGRGDGLSIGYANTDGSNGVDLSYNLPINAHNGTLDFFFSRITSNIIESPFNVLDINAESREYQLTFRQPLIQTPTRELALGVGFARRETEATFIQELQAPFPSPGADERGRTRISELRFFQEYTQRSPQNVIAFRSQFSFGLGILGATINPTPPDGRFFFWQGQAQLLHSLGNDKLLFLRADVQLADKALPTLEQFGVGGQLTVRGYRQDYVLGDSGALASAEVRLPVIRDKTRRAVLQVAPFADVGTVFNSDAPNPSPNTLASLGLSLLVQSGDRFSARLDYGIPLVDVKFKGRTWQDNGVYFSVVYNLF